MRRPRFTIASLLGVVVYVAIAIAALKAATDFWDSALFGPSIKAQIMRMPAGDRDSVKARTEALMPRDAAGRIVYRARANAAKGVAG